MLLATAGSRVMAAGVGFQGRLTDLPRVVSSYEDTPDQFSAAIYPRTYSALNQALIYQPKLEYGTASSQSLTFKTKVSKDVYLIPISVEGQRYVARRTEMMAEQSRRDLFRKTLKTAKDENKRQGLSIGVGLPKRFDQMFGEGGANLRVSGYRRITFSGRSQWSDNAGTGLVKQSKFPSLNMEQISRFDITGTIGSKITVKVSQDNQTDIPLANRLLLRYKGDEDDILQTLEAGNTTLSIPNTRFVGYSSNIQGLFGLKAEAKVGNLQLTAIASQEKGSSEAASVSAGGTENKITIRDFNYAEGRIFDLAYPGGFNPKDTILEYHVYQYQSESVNDDEGALRNAEHLIDPSSEDEDLFRESFRVIELSSGYQLWYVGDTTHSPVALVFDGEQRKAISVYMKVLRRPAAGNPDTVEIGSILGDKLRLMCLRPNSNYTSDHPAWKLMWRNCYRISKGVDVNDLDLRVMRGKPGTEGASTSKDIQENESGLSQGTLLRILGLDLANRSGNGTSDAKLDDDPDIFRPDWGLIIFRSREPFNSDTTFVDSSGLKTQPLDPKLRVPEIYTYTSSTKAAEASQYFLEISSQIKESIVRLGRANVIEGSERVTANGRVLEKGKDYNIQYDFGQVTLLSEEALDPNADVKVEFQYAPFLAMQKKSLLGARAEYEWSEDLKFGSTVLYKSDKAQQRKPKIGQETATAMVLDFDVAFGLHPNFLTKAVDALPLVSTESESRISVSAEIAQSRPNPNVDGVAYIDDFEAAVEELSLGMSRNNWTISSVPFPVRQDSSATPRWARGAMRWHNPGAIARSDVYGGDIAAGEGSLQPMRLIFRPKHFVDSVIDDTVCTGELAPSRSWGGMMRYFGNRVDAERVQLFEFRARGGKGTMHFDFGIMSDDMNGDGKRNTEDQSYPENNALDDGEDIGLDLIHDTSEVDECGRGYDPVSNPDPAGDNWWFDGFTDSVSGAPAPASAAALNTIIPNAGVTLADILSNDAYEDNFYRYEWINGTEGSTQDDAVRGIPDDEALVPGSTDINRQNSYFSVAVPLSPDADNPFVVAGSDKNEWYTYRIPIREPGVVDTVTDGTSTPGWDKVSFVRVWFEQDATIDAPSDSLNYIDSIWIANWGFVQSNWRDTLLQVNENDSLSEFYAASVSEDVGTFSPPPGVEAYHDDVTNTTESQRGLALNYRELPPGDTGVTTKSLLSVESYSGYRDLQMYVHGPDDLGADSVMVFFRVGTDSLNYYEYHTLVSPGWSESNYIDIDFNEITALKDAANQALEKNTQRVDTTDGHYRVVGKPNLNQVGTLSIGLVNVGTGRVSGEVWVDELRVTDVRKDIGTAARVAVDGTMADLLSYGFSYDHQDPYFRGLSQATRGGSSNNLGSGSETNGFSYNTRLNLQKFLPRSWGATLPVSFGYTHSEEIPLLRTGTDIILPDSVRQEEKSTSTSYKISASESFNKKGSNPLFSALLNRQKMSMSYSRSYRITVTNPWQFNENYNIRGDYEMGIKRDMSVPVFFWTKPLPILKRASASRLSFFPTLWKWSADYSRTVNVRDDQDLNRSSSFNRQLNGSMNMQYAVFPNLTTTYSMTTRRNLSEPSQVRLSFRSPKLGLEENYRQDFRVDYDPKVFGFLGSALQYQATYSDTYDRSTKSLTTDLNRSWSIGGSFRHLDLLGGRSGGGKGQGARPRRGGVDEEEKPPGKPFYEPVLAGLRFVTGWLSPLSYNYTESMRQAVPGALMKPSWKYRLALATSPEFLRGTTTRNPSSSKSMSYKLGSGFGLLGGITTTLGYSRSIDEDIIVVGQHRKRRTSTGWPELSISIQKFRVLPLLKGPVNWFIGVFSPRTTYSRQLSETYDLDSKFSQTRSETVNRNPLLSLNFKVFKAFSLSSSYGTGLTVDERFNAVDGRLQSVTRSNRKSVTVSSKYSFTAPGGIGLPLFGKLKFKSTVSIDLSVKYDMSNAETSNSGAPYVVTSDKSSFQVSPKISYTFSRQIQGGLTARWQDTNDLKLKRKSHVREIQIWTEITF